MAQSGERIGSTIAGFEVEAPVGVGGMGAVYLARDPTLKRRVALKVVAPALADDPRYRTRFLREAELAASLDHPAIVPVYAAGESDGDLYLAMRYVEGGSLADRLLADGRLEPERATALLAPVAAALDAAHAAGLAHRDVKPGNILLDGDHAYLADFGLARPTTATASAPATAAGLRGTVGYLAPEQLEGQPASPQADQYALACVLFECLTGRRPFERENDIAVVYAHHTEAPPGVTSVAAGLPKEIDAVVARGLAKRPADRFRSCGELIEAAARACGVRVDAPGRAHRRRRSMLVGAIAGAAVAALAGVGALLLPGTRSVEAAVAAGPSDPVVVIDGTTGSIVGRIDAGSSPSRIAIGADAAWVLNADVRTVTRIDLETLEPGQPFAVVGDPVDLAVGVTPLDRAAGAPAVWVATGTGAAASSAGTGTLADTVVPVDPSTLAPLGRVPLGVPAAEDAVSAGGGMVSAANALWVVQADGTVARIRARGLEVTDVVRDVEARVITATEDAVWALGERLWRIDPASAEVTDVVDLGATADAHAIAAGGGAVWVSSWADGTIWRVDAAAPEQREALPGPPHAAFLAYVGGSVWTLVRGDEATLSAIDPATGRVVRQVSVGAAAHGVATDGKRLFVTTTGRSAPASESDTGHVDVQSSACTPAEHGPGVEEPQFLIVSDLPLSGASASGARSMADAVRSVLAARGWRAGGYSIGYQSCSNANERGRTAELRCSRNAAGYAATPRVLGVIGTGDPFCTLAELQRLATAPGGPVAVISPSAADSLDAMDRVGTQNLARLTPSYSSVVGALLSFAGQDLGARRLLVVAREPSWYAAFGAVPAARLGMTLHTSVWPEDPTTLADRVTQAGADAVAVDVDGFAAEAGSALRELRRRLGPDVPVIALNALPVSDFVTWAGRDVAAGTYVLSTAPTFDDLTARGQAWVRTFAASQPDGVAPAAPVAAQAAEVLLDAIARSDGTRASVTRAVARTQVSDGLLPAFRLDQHGNAAPSPVTVLRVQGAGQASGDLQPAFAGATVVKRITAPGFDDAFATRRGDAVLALTTHRDEAEGPWAVRCSRATATRCSSRGTFDASDAATARRLCPSGTYRSDGWRPATGLPGSLDTLTCADGSTLVLRRWALYDWFRPGGQRTELGWAWRVVAGTGRLAGVTGEGVTREDLHSARRERYADGVVSGELRAQ